MKKIGVFGSGAVGESLSNGFLKHGYSVMRGSRDPSKLEEWKTKAGEHARTGTFAETAAFGELLVLAVKGSAAVEVLNLAGKEAIAGKTIIDTTNPLADGGPEKGVLKVTTNSNDSLMEHIQKAFPEANFVKAFSSVGNAVMVNPNYGGTLPSMFICGDDAKAKSEVTKHLTEFGWETEDMGPALAARAIEPLCILWCIPGFAANQWTHAFKLLKMKA